MGNLTLRPARPSDPVRTVYERAMEGVGVDAGRVPASDLDDVAVAYADGAFLVGTVDGEVVATGGVRAPAAVERAVFGLAGDAGAGSDASVGVVRRLAVDPDHQRRGYGHRLYERLEERARDREWDALVLDTRVRMDDAQRFHRRNGFRPDHVVTVDVRGEPVSTLVYRKRL